MEKLRPRGGVCSDLRWGRLGRQRRPAGGADEPVGAEAQVPGEDGPQRLGSTWTSGELPDPGGFSTLTWKEAFLPGMTLYLALVFLKEKIQSGDSLCRVGEQGVR